MKVHPEGAVTLEGPQDKDSFLSYLEGQLLLVTQFDYVQMNEDPENQEMIAWLHYERGDESGTFHSLEVIINSDKFSQFAHRDDLLVNLQKVVARHESAELWYLLCSDLREHRTQERGRGPAHQQALLEEWRYACELGCQEEYLACIQQWAEQRAAARGEEEGRAFLQENIAAYEWVMKEVAPQRLESEVA